MKRLASAGVINRPVRPRTVGVWGNAGGFSKRDGVQQFTTAERSEAMGIDWMTGSELSEAIPPAYSRYIAEQLFPNQPTPATVREEGEHHVHRND